MWMGDGSRSNLYSRTEPEIYLNGILDLSVLNFLSRSPLQSISQWPTFLLPSPHDLLHNVIQPPHFPFRAPQIQILCNKRFFFSSLNSKPCCFLIQSNFLFV